MTIYERAADLALFLTERTGSCYGTWRGRLSAKEQRALLGRYLGKGLITIDGAEERVKMTVKVCFGLDFDVRQDLSWNELV